jgi:hypothetical protein
MKRRVFLQTLATCGVASLFARRSEAQTSRAMVTRSTGLRWAAPKRRQADVARTQIRLVALGVRAVGALQLLFEYAPVWLDRERFRLTPDTILLDHWGRFGFRVADDAAEDGARVLMADITSLPYCRAMYVLCNDRDRIVRSFFRSFSMASILLPDSDFKLGWDAYDGRARAASALALEGLRCGNVVAATQADRYTDVAAARADYDALAAPVVLAYGRRSERSADSDHRMGLYARIHLHSSPLRCRGALTFWSEQSK